MKSPLAHWIITRFSKWLTYEPPLPPSFLYDFDKIRFEIRPADVLLVEGRNRVSYVIKQITLSNWSHSALYIGRLHDIDNLQIRNRVLQFYSGNPDEQLLIESVMGRGTIITPLSYYKDRNIRICRPRSLSREDAQQIIDYTVDHLGTRYSTRHILDLARFLFPWGVMPRRWRSSLFVHNALKPTEEICSSLIASAFQAVHFPILPEIIHSNDGITLVSRNPRLFTPRDFDFSPFFDIIKYPMLPVISEGIYKHLPWQEDKVTGDEYIHITKEPRERLITLVPKLAEKGEEREMEEKKEEEENKKKP